MSESVARERRHAINFTKALTRQLHGWQDETIWLSPDVVAEMLRDAARQASDTSDIEEILKEVKRMASVWLYTCKLGLAQSTCGKYRRDTDSRGDSQRLGGCCSCSHRKPDNAETMRADAEYAAS